MEDGVAGERQLVLAASAFPTEDLTLFISRLHHDIVNMVLDARPSLFPIFRTYVALAKTAVDRFSKEVPRTGLFTYYWLDLPIPYGFMPATTARVNVFFVPVLGLAPLLRAAFLLRIQFFRLGFLLLWDPGENPFADLTQHITNQIGKLLNLLPVVCDRPPVRQFLVLPNPAEHSKLALRVF